MGEWLIENSALVVCFGCVVLSVVIARAAVRAAQAD